MLQKLIITYESMKKIVLIFLVLLSINYSFNTIFNFTYLLPTILASLALFYVLMQFLFPQKFKFLREDMFMISIVLYCLFHALFFQIYENTLLVVGMSFVPYFFSRYIILEDDDIEFFVKIFCIFGVILLGVYFKYIASHAVEGRLSIDNREPVGISADFGMVAIAFSYILFVTKKYWVKIVSLFLILATLYITIFALAARGASFTIIMSIAILYFLLSTGTIKDIFKRFFLIFGFIIFFLFATNNNFFIDKYPNLERFSIKNIVNDPGVVGSRRYRGRKDLILESFEVILRSPFFGEGIFVVYSHNIFLEWIASLGLIGLLPFLLFLFCVFKKSFECKKYNPKFAFLFTILCYSFILRLVSFSMFSHKAFFIICGLFLSFYDNYEKISTLS